MYQKQCRKELRLGMVKKWLCQDIDVGPADSKQFLTCGVRIKERQEDRIEMGGLPVNTGQP